MQIRPGKLTTLLAGTLAMASAIQASNGPMFSAMGEPNSFQIDLDVPEVQLIEEGEYVRVVIAGHALRMEKNEPELPILTTSLLLPDTGIPRATIEVLDEETLQLDKPVAPSRGHLTRDVALSTVPRVQGAVYESGSKYPADEFQVEMGNPYILRDVRGSALRISPVVLDLSNNTLRVLKKARVQVQIHDSALGINSIRERRSAPTREFVELYKNLFLNVDGQPILDLDSENAGYGLILAHDDFVENMKPLQAWREKKGFASELVALSSIREGDGEGPITANEIQEYIRKKYLAGGLTYVLFVGDADRVPTLKGVKEGADCDSCYAKLEGDDHVPDLFMSRFSANNATEVDIQVNRAINYERNPQVGADAAGYLKGIGLGSNEGTPPDFERVEILRTALMDWRFTEMAQLYDEKGYGSHRVTPDEVTTAVQGGSSVIAYMGHGSDTSWVTSRFGTRHIKDLTNTKHHPMIWDVACVNGNFVNKNCFAEAWAKAGTPEAPAGAIGIVAATTNMSWHPPVDWQAHAVKDFMIPGKAFTGGALHHFALVKAMEKWGDTGSSQGVMMVEQCVFFGDSSVVLRNDIPKAVTVSRDNGNLVVKAGDAVVKNARVVLESAGERWVKITDAEGMVSLPTVEGNEAPTFVATVTGPNLVPMLDQEIAP